MLPVVFASKAPDPTVVFVETEFAPLPTLKPLIVEEETIVVAVIAWNVEIPEATCSPVVFPNILNPLAVTIPTESTLVHLHMLMFHQLILCLVLLDRHSY